MLQKRPSPICLLATQSSSYCTPRQRRCLCSGKSRASLSQQLQHLWHPFQAYVPKLELENGDTRLTVFLDCPPERPLQQMVRSMVRSDQTMNRCIILPKTNKSRTQVRPLEYLIHIIISSIASSYYFRASSINSSAFLT